jgi:hypothetical protein
MSFVIIFALGYAAGGISALLLIGLTFAGRSHNSERRPTELVSHDAENYSL